MKNHAIRLLVLMLVSLPALLRAQTGGGCIAESQNRYTAVLVTMPSGEQLTQQEADCALDLVSFTAAAVRGEDLIQVDEPMRQMWRNYLAYYYPTRTLAQHAWLTSAPATYLKVVTDWPNLSPLDQQSVRQAWAAKLPATLEFVQPVLAAAWQQRQGQQMNIPAGGTYYQSDASDGGASAIQQLNKMQDQAVDLQRFQNRMTDLTIMQMHAMSGQYH